MKRIQAILFLVLLMTMLFSQTLYAQGGPPGTGKTMPAGVIANNLSGPSK